MSRPYWSGGRSRGGNTYADDGDHAPTDHGTGEHSPAGDYDRPSYESPYDSSGYDSSGYDNDATELIDVEDYDGYEYRDTRWRWIAGAAAAVLFIVVVAIATVLGNDSATSTSPTESNEVSAPAQDSAPATSRAPRTVIATPAPGPATDLAPETVVTVTPTPSAVHPAPAAPPPPPLAEAPAADRTITYTVTGERQLFDLVTIIYTDEQGFPRTEINAALPWTRTVALNPGVQTQSVTATSVTGRLNCVITDGNGATVIAQNNNTLITTCTK
ncbi:hypothetical protein [[Mycobacterium] burgundiense]|uniref:MmpS3 protein n=1 Tax=[Mycobacterium] burgundiense TaxID=3064286 RepID=A0ABM9LZH9_9MYCO|nr:hypothetical protein [Mycolicibacterium sp. MU0053]CAJ1507419.1 hypothetical protein MU0053_003506 [Mycolicibacterium sp. MU0053]